MVWFSFGECGWMWEVASVQPLWLFETILILDVLKIITSVHACVCTQRSLCCYLRPATYLMFWRSSPLLMRGPETLIPTVLKILIPVDAWSWDPHTYCSEDPLPCWCVVLRPSYLLFWRSSALLMRGPETLIPTVLKILCPVDAWSWDPHTYCSEDPLPSWCMVLRPSYLLFWRSSALLMHGPETLIPTVMKILCPVDAWSWDPHTYCYEDPLPCWCMVLRPSSYLMLWRSSPLSMSVSAHRGAAAGGGGHDGEKGWGGGAEPIAAVPAGTGDGNLLHAACRHRWPQAVQPPPTGGWPRQNQQAAKVGVFVSVWVWVYVWACFYSQRCVCGLYVGVVGWVYVGIWVWGRQTDKGRQANR